MFTNTDPSWSLGALVWLPVAAVLVLLAVGAGVIFLMMRADTAPSPYSDRGPLLAFAIISFVTALLLVGGTAWGMYPYSAEYHQWNEVSGTVEQIDRRLIGSGDSMEDKFVVRYAESGDQFACDDTRCAQVREGDTLTLSCKRAWQFTGTDGWDCRFVGTEVTR